MNFVSAKRALTAHAFYRSLVLFFCLVALPIVFGTSIYVLFRSQNLLVSSWFENVGFDELILTYRNQIDYTFFPSWVLTSLPDGLWVFAFTAWIILIWDGRPPWYWLLSAPFFGIGSEIGQASSIVPGAYDQFDILFYGLGFMLACLTLGAVR